MEQYRTIGVMDKAALQEVQKYLFRSRLDWVRWIAVAVIAGCALLALIARDWFDGGLYLFLAAFVFLFPRLIQRRYVKNQLARMRELFHGGRRGFAQSHHTRRGSHAV